MRMDNCQASTPQAGTPFGSQAKRILSFRLKSNGGPMRAW